MQGTQDQPDLELLAAPPAFRKTLVAALAVSYLIFVAGGFFFGWVFLANVNAVLGHGAPAIPGASGFTLPAVPLGNVLGPPSILPEWTGTKRINVLLLGIDQRPDEKKLGIPSRSDSMIVVSIDPVSKTAAMISFPRDMWVPIPGYGEQRINVAHFYGEEQRRGGGPDLAAKTIEADFGPKIDYWARVDFDGLVRLVDAVGGVIIDVPKPIKDDEYPTRSYGIKRIYIAPGPQLMDGETALEYARTRHADSDFARMERQQEVLLAVRRRVLQLNMLPKIPSLISIVQDTVATSMSPVQMLALARLAQGIDRSHIKTLVIDERYATPFTGEDGAFLLRPNFQKIKQAIQSLLATPAASRGPARIQVLNGSNIPGIAAKAGAYLSKQGFDVVNVDTANRNDYVGSTVQVLNGDKDAGEAVAGALALPLTDVVEVPTPNPPVDVRVILGRSFKLEYSAR